MYIVQVNDPPKSYPTGFFPRKYHYLDDAKKEAQEAIDRGATLARIEFPNGAELDFRHKSKGVKQP